MEHCTDRTSISRDQKCAAAGKKSVPSHARQSAKLRDILMSDNPTPSCADVHRETERSQNAPKHVHSQQNRVSEKTTPKEDEVVKYMSKLPSFLEKGKNLQEQALNVGVLDWKRLEKWRHSKLQTTHKHNGCSPSSSNTSLFSTDESSTHSSRGLSFSPVDQRTHHLSLQSPLEASPKEGFVQEAKSSSSRGHSCSPVRQRMHIRGREKSQDFDVFRGIAGKFQDSTSISASNLSRQHMVLGALQQHDRKASDSRSLSEMGHQSAFDKSGVMGKTKTERNRSTKETLKSRETKLDAAHQDCSRREESGVVIPRNRLETSFSGATTSSYFTANDRLLVEPGPRNISRRNNCEDILPSKVHSRKGSVGYGSQDQESVTSSSQASKTLVQTSKIFHDTSMISTKTGKAPSQASQTFSYPARMLRSPPRERSTEEKKPVAGLRSMTAAKPFEELKVRKSSESIPKSRNQSPIRRLSFAMGKMIKNAGSRDNSPLRRPSSMDCAVRSVSEGAIASTSIDNSCSHKSSANSNNNNRGRSSPLKRLLDPFLRTRGSNSNEPSKKHSSPPLGTGKSCNDQVDCCNSVKVKSRSSGGNTSITDPHHNSKGESSSLQALLQVSFKNGFPLFTFAIDNESEVLAATVRKSFVPEKGHHNWTYTFFTVQETKRKSGIWLNKSDSHGYVPSVVAQMKVSDSQESPSSKYENVDFHITREFDLFAVDVGHEDPHATDFHPTNELAAIIVKLPRILSQYYSKDDQLNYNWLDLSDSAFTESMQEMRSSDDDFHRFPRGLNFSTTIILPGGVHTIPSKGEISTLVQRWRSSGSCDCGGWDLGCQLLVYSNKREYEGKTGSSGSCSSENTFQLFSQVGQDNQPVLSLAPFKERIYSVEFNSSLSILQAFAVCISFLDRRRPPELSESGNVAEKITDEVGVCDIPSKMKTQVDAPVRYVSFPPHSTVERV